MLSRSNPRNCNKPNEIMPELSLLTKVVPAIVVVIILVAIILPQAIRIPREYERGVIFRL